MNSQKKKYETPRYEVVRFNARIVTEDTGEDCYEMHSIQTGTDCHVQEVYEPET